jgi:hypothetical protein
MLEDTAKNEYIKISEDEINIPLTEKAKKDPKYIQYLEWLTTNGVKMHGIDFPVAFGPYGYIGIATKNEEIPAQKVIVAVPTKLSISVNKVKESELG